MANKKKKIDMKTIPRLEYRRLKELDQREIKMKPLILQLAAFMRRKKTK